MAVPFQLAAWYAAVVPQAIDDAGNAARHGCAGIGYAIAQRVAGANLNGHLVLLSQLHQLAGKGDDKAVVVGPGNVLKVTPRDDPVFQGRFHDAKILIHRLAAGLMHLFKDMVIGAGYEDAGFLHAHMLHQGEIALGGADPGGDLREFIAPEKQMDKTRSLNFTSNGMPNVDTRRLFAEG